MSTGVTRSRTGLVALFAADLTTTLSTWLSIVAIPWLVLTTTGSPTKMGVIAAAEWVPLLLSSVFGPPLVDRIGLKLTSVATDFGSALAMAAIALIPRIGFLPLFFLVAVAGTLRGGGDRAKHVLLRPMAEAAGAPMIKVSGAYETMNRVAQLVGAPLGGLLVFWFTAQGTILWDAVTFAACAALVAAFVHPHPVDAPATTSYATALRDGARYLTQDRLLPGMIAALFLLNVFTQANASVFVPLWISEVLRSPAGLGLVSGSYAIGAVLGSLTFTALSARLPRLLTFSLAALLAGSPRLFALGLTHNLPVVLAVTFLSGVAVSPAAPIAFTVLYERVPTHLQTRVFGLVAGICIAGFPLGGLLAGWAVSTLGLHTALTTAALTCLILTLLSLQPYLRQPPRSPQ